MGSTWDALRLAEQDRERAVGERTEALEQLGEDVNGLRVTVHALEDRVGLELGGLQDELRQAIAKAQDLTAVRERAAEDRLRAQLGWLAETSQRGERRINALCALAGLALIAWLFRC